MSAQAPAHKADGNARERDETESDETELDDSLGAGDMLRAYMKKGLR
jgi:hypothetical protein